MVYQLCVSMEFSAAHKIEGTIGKCSQLHGHTYTVQVAVASNKLNPNGMVMDSTLLKACLKTIIDNLDHTYLNTIISQPTMECLAEYIFNNLRNHLKDEAVHLDWIRIWESPHVYVTYSPWTQ